MSDPKRLSATRRAVLGTAAFAAATPALAGSRADDEAEAKRLLERYDGFGIKASGGPGDNAAGAWLEDELKGMGYAIRRHPFESPAYEGGATLEIEGTTANLIPQAVVVTTGPAGVSGPLYVAGVGRSGPGIALIVLPYARWSTALGFVEARIRAAIASGAQAAVVVTTGPTGEALALNAPADRPLFDKPVAVLAPRDAEPFLKVAASGGTARLRMAGRAYTRPAFNVTATLDRGSKAWLVLSTPRSGWFGCVGERGSGLAVWHMLSAWAARAPLAVNIALVATSGHEYEYLGGEKYIAELAPKPAATTLWVHIGANVAARDWHERGATLSPLPGADSQRFLLASAPFVDRARAAFAGLPGLEAAYPADPKLAAGELGSILHAGYGRAMGIFGAHRFHHARNDDLRCVSPALVPPVVDAFKTTIGGVLGTG